MTLILAISFVQAEYCPTCPRMAQAALNAQSGLVCRNGTCFSLQGGQGSTATSNSVYHTLAGNSFPEPTLTKTPWGNLYLVGGDSAAQQLTQRYAQSNGPSMAVLAGLTAGGASATLTLGAVSEITSSKAPSLFQTLPNGNRLFMASVLDPASFANDPSFVSMANGNLLYNPKTGMSYALTDFGDNRYFVPLIATKDGMFNPLSEQSDLKGGYSAYHRAELAARMLTNPNALPDDQKAWALGALKAESLGNLNANQLQTIQKVLSSAEGTPSDEVKTVSEAVTAKLTEAKTEALGTVLGPAVGVPDLPNGPETPIKTH